MLTGWAASATAQTETIEYYATDAVGSVRVVFDATGNVLGRMDYEPFGRELFKGVFPITEHFGGQSVDGESGQGFFHARQYASRTGRFSRVDPIYAGLFDPQRWNRYAYAGNNPIRFLDPFGLQASETEEWWQNCANVLAINAYDHNCTGSGGGSTASDGGGGGTSAWQDALWIGSFLTDTFTGTVVLDSGELVATGHSYTPSTTAKGIAAGIVVAVVVASPVAKALSPKAATAAVESLTAKATAKVVAQEAFHYTFTESVESILRTGLREGAYATIDGNLSPNEASMLLALPTGRGNPTAMLRIDLAGLRGAGYEIPAVTQVAPSFGMPGGGYEMRFPYSVPAQFISPGWP
jgi:RHS repeat-associated protein